MTIAACDVKVLWYAWACCGKFQWKLSRSKANVSVSQPSAEKKMLRQPEKLKFCCEFKKKLRSTEKNHQRKTFELLQTISNQSKSSLEKRLS